MIWRPVGAPPLQIWRYGGRGRGWRCSKTGPEHLHRQHSTTLLQARHAHIDIRNPKNKASSLHKTRPMLTVHSQPIIPAPLHLRGHRIHQIPKLPTPRSLNRIIRSSSICLARQIKEEDRINQRGGGDIRGRSISFTSKETKKMLLVQCLFGGIVASLLGFLLLSRSKSQSQSQSQSQFLLNSKKRNGSERVRWQCGSDSAGGYGGPDVIIVGAGVAGAALAYTLGKDGRQVCVIERDLTEPDRIVGELLQPGGYLKLIELGIEDCVEEIDAQRILGYALFKDGKDTKLSYPLNKYHSDVAGRSFHNGRFIQRMREKAATMSNVKLEQGTVTTLLEENGIVKGVSYKTGAGEERKAYAPLTVVCDGCFSNLRRTLCTPKVDVPSCFVALVLENCHLPYPNHGHVVIADPSPILFYPISSTEVRCLVDVPGKKLPPIANGGMANYLRTVVAPQLPNQLCDAFISAVDRGSIRSMPNRSMPASPHPTPGALLLGDAFNMRHPLTGGGMTVALSDIVLLCNLLKPLDDLHDAAALCKYLESFYTLRKPVASTINTLAGALYKVFSASSDQARIEMREACFDYLSLGGAFSSGPISLLSGLNPRPMSLVAHFFAVAVYGVGRLLLPFPSPKRLWIGARLILVASAIIFPIIKAEGVRQMFFPATIPSIYRTPPTH